MTNSSQYALNVGCNGKHTEESINAETCGLQIDEHVSWKNHID